MNVLRDATPRALVLVALFGFLWAKSLGLTVFLDPTNLDWMMQGDWLAHLMGWLFTRYEPWAVPLAQAPGLIAPTGTSAALTDAIPLLSVIGKLVSPFFGDRLQLFGGWMVTGVVATGVVGVLVGRAWLKDTASLTLAGCLFVMNAVVSTRAGHPAFFGFWTLSALVGMNLWPVTDLRSARRVAAVSLAVTFVACGIHAYLAVMAGGLLGAAMARLALVRRDFRPLEAVLWLCAAPLTWLLSLWLFGFLSGARGVTANLASEGFGEFSADLLTLVNPSIWSRFVPALPTGPRQYEGYAWLGLGVLGLLVVRLGVLVRRRPERRAVLESLPLVVVVTLMAFFALSNHVTLAGRPLADLSGLYAHAGPWPSVFRSSGRFVCPLFAALTLAAVLGAAQLRTRTGRVFLLGGAALLQLADFDTPRIALNHHAGTAAWQFKDPAWQLMGQGYRHVVIHPIQLQWTCPFDGPLVAGLSWEAYRQRLSINSGHVGRPPPGTDCKRHLQPGELDAETVYVPYFPDFVGDVQRPGMTCGPVEGRLVCVSSSHDTALLRELRLRATRGPEGR